MYKDARKTSQWFDKSRETSTALNIDVGPGKYNTIDEKHLNPNR